MVLGHYDSNPTLGLVRCPRRRRLQGRLVGSVPLVGGRLVLFWLSHLLQILDRAVALPVLGGADHHHAVDLVAGLVWKT